MTPHIQTANGYFNFITPRQEDVSIEAVADALSKLCRFTGHCREFYSIAQHSVLVAQLCPPQLRLWGLLHDAVEAFVGDVASPLKQLLPEYKAIEHRVERVVWARFGLQGDRMPAEVKVADLCALAIERRDLMPFHPDSSAWGHLPPIPRCLDFTIEPLPPKAARELFMAWFDYLKGIA